MPDLVGHQIQRRPGGDGRRAGQVPHLAGRAGVGAQGCQASGDVGNVAVGVGRVRVADEVGAAAGQGVAEDPLAERGPLSDAGAEEVRGPPDGDTDPAGLGGAQQFGGHRRPGPALDGRRGQRQVLSQGLAAGRAVAVEVLQAHQQRAGAFSGSQDAALQRWEELRPLGVGCVQALVDDGGALRSIAGRIKIGRVRRPPVIPSAKPAGRCRDTTRTVTPRSASKAASTLPACPAPKTTCSLPLSTSGTGAATASAALISGHCQASQQPPRSGHVPLDGPGAADCAAAPLPRRCPITPRLETACAAGAGQAREK